MGLTARAVLTICVLVLACDPPVEHGATLAGVQVGSRSRVPTLSIEDLDDLLNGPTSGEKGAGVTSRDAKVTSVAEYRAFIRQRLHDRTTYDVLAPKLFGLLDNHVTASFPIVGTTLKKGESAKGAPYYYAASTCRDDDLVEVVPWWSEDSKPVLVCQNDYRPKTVFAKDGVSYCDGTQSREGCGCGPYLIYCARDEDMEQALKAAPIDEVVLTLKYVVENGRPFKDLLTMNATVRSGMGEYFYARSRFLKTGKFERWSLSAPPELRPRDSEYQGGLLSTPLFLYGDFSRRVVMVTEWSDFLCAPFRSIRVDDSTLLAAARSHPALRAAFHEELVTTPGCQNCHVRLEYGQMAVSGWVNGMLGMHYNPALVVPTTKFYVQDQTDLRGEGPATPAWLGTMFASQPEFADCMVRKAAGIFYAGYPVPPQIHDRLREHFTTTWNMAELLEDAAIARAFGGN
jgi:hypothetical protein